MEVYESDRRNSRRIPLKTALRLRVWKSASAERGLESENVSEHGTFFASDSPMAIGTAVEILLKMPEEITEKPTTEWRCTGHVVRLQPVDASRSRLGVGVQFHYYEILRSRRVIPS